jgi:hypothetical protein
MHLYNDLAKVSVLVNIHSFKLILGIPLNPANRHFTFFRIIALSTRISSDKYVQYIVDHAYLGLRHNQQAYTLLTETSFNRCKKNTLTICSADITVYQA